MRWVSSWERAKWPLAVAVTQRLRIWSVAARSPDAWAWMNPTMPSRVSATKRVSPAVPTLNGTRDETVLLSAYHSRSRVAWGTGWSGESWETCSSPLPASR